MNYQEKKSVKYYLCRALYRFLAFYLPDSDKKLFKVIRIGYFARKIRYITCRNLFDHCGKNVNIQKGATFGRGLRVGDNSGLGGTCVIPSFSIIGNDVMMGPNCYIHARNHSFERTDIPMNKQGFSEEKPVIIDDDVWIGRDVTIMVGRHISKGTIIAANSVVTKDFPPYSIIGGNPAQLIRSRI